MKITRLVLSDFGKFHQEEVTLAPGLNIATGANESGKTTLRQFIRSMFYGLERERGIKARKDDYTRFKPWDYGRFQGILEFEAEGKIYRLFRNFLTTEKEVSITELASGRSIENPGEFLKSVGLKSETIYTNTFWVGNECATKELLAEELRDYLVNLAYGGGAGLNLQKSLGWLAAQKKELIKRMPEKELAECLEILLTKDMLEEQLGRAGQGLDSRVQLQKELEEKIKNQKSLSVQLISQRKPAEDRTKLKPKGERLLTIFCALAAGLAVIACFLPGLYLKLMGWMLGAIAFFCGLGTGLPRIRQGKLAVLEKEELERRIEAVAGQTETAYEELTRLLPQIEQEKFRMEQLEEQRMRCDIAKERYEELKRQKQELEQSVEAINLAYTSLEQLSAKMYEEFGAKFADALSEYAKAFTDHSYETLTADEDLILRAVTDRRSLEIPDVSFGTGEQFYLALRFAAADVFDPEKKNPVILDDSFAAFDDQRLESAVLTLAKSGRQILVLSSTGREEAAAKRMGITYEAVF